MKETACMDVLDTFIVSVRKKYNVVFSKTDPRFPGMAGETQVYQFKVRDVVFTLATHVRIDRAAFVVKLFYGDVKRFFSDTNQKKFSQKSNRQKDPFLFRGTYHLPSRKEESWSDTQVPGDNPDARIFLSVVHELEHFFLTAIKK